MKVIADACANHGGSRKTMAKMVQRAAKIGADVVKFQSFKAGRLNKDWPDYENALAYYKQHELSAEDHIFLVGEADKHNIELLFTAFDPDRADFLSTLGLERVKIASPDCNNWTLIDKCLTKFDHLLISVGMHSNSEVLELAKFLGDERERVTVLHCVSLYPTPPDKVNLLRMGWLMHLFPSVGFSDHTLGTDAAKMALSLGAACVEKHFTLDRSLPGKDQAISGTPDEFAELVAWRDKVQTMMYCPEQMADEGARHYIGRWTA